MKILRYAIGVLVIYALGFLSSSYIFIDDMDRVTELSAMNQIEQMSDKDKQERLQAINHISSDSLPTTVIYSLADRAENDRDADVRSAAMSALSQQLNSMMEGSLNILTKRRADVTDVRAILLIQDIEDTLNVFKIKRQEFNEASDVPSGETM